jgi:hypothetical protein
VPLCLFSEPKTLQIIVLGFLMRAAEPAIVMVVFMCSLISFLAPRFLPFFGYLFCRLAQDWFREDPCAVADKQLYNIPSFGRSHILNIIRFLGFLVTFVTYASGCWNSVLVVYYEVLPSLLFQKNCLRQFQNEVKHCTFSQHATAVLKYRQLQILNTMFNNIYSRDFFAICIFFRTLHSYSYGIFHSYNP